MTDSPFQARFAVNDWRLAVAVGLLVGIMQGAIVLAIGTDLPWWDQWGVEGQQIYLPWVDGTFEWSSLWSPHNEHRIVWTHLLNLVLFKINGQWDPSLQQGVGVGLRSFAAMWLTWRLAGGRWWLAAFIVLAFLPVPAWHNAIWGFQSQVYFALGFGLVALSFGLGNVTKTGFTNIAGGTFFALCAALAMGPGLLVPIAWLGALVWVMWSERNWKKWGPGLAVAAVLSILVVVLRVSVAEPRDLAPTSWWQGAQIVVMGLAWPHASTALTAGVMNAPFVAFLISGAIGGLHRITARDRELVGYGIWAWLIVAGMAIARGGGSEMQAGVPSRYVDFLVVSSIVNGWAVARWVGLVSPDKRRLAKIVAGLWLGFWLIGWAGLIAQNWRGLVSPRLADREAPIRLMQEYQRTRDPTVFAGVPKLYLPYPDLAVVDEVLGDERLAGRLPPSLQPLAAMGLGSRIMAGLRRRPWPWAIVLLFGAGGLVGWEVRRHQKALTRD